MSGEDISINTEDLCEFTCSFGYCLEMLCHCAERGIMRPAPAANDCEYREFNASDVEFNRMCNFACKRNYFSLNICGNKEIEFDKTELAEVNDGDEVSDPALS